MLKKRILIVEDQALVAEDIRQHLMRMDYEIIGLTNSGEQAVQLAKELQPDLVLMDVSLDGLMDGFEAGRLIEQSTKCAITYDTSDPRARKLPHSLQKPFTKGRSGWLSRRRSPERA